TARNPLHPFCDECSSAFANTKKLQKGERGALMQEIILEIIAVSCFILFTITTIKTRGRGKVYYILSSLIVLTFILVTYISKYL
ncbi:hypothetical protein, partial [Bacillus amyloliquefaciens]|uniref:hypothetical protein n=1 Tax=Bacillus amyloliquefaciens TaxID=1390 RepID=UPI003A8B9B60